MMEVRWDFKGDELGQEAAETAVHRVLDRYSRPLANVKCPVHGKVPVLVVRGHSLDDLDLTVETCCQALLDDANSLETCCQALLDDANSRIRAAARLDTGRFTDAEIEKLRAAVQRIHGAPAAYRRTETVREILAGKPWASEVAVFDLLGHHRSAVCFAWPSMDGKRFFAVLQEGPVRSSLDAVRTSIEQGYRGEAAP
jgi:hypothetical protein